MLNILHSSITKRTQMGIQQNTSTAKIDSSSNTPGYLPVLSDFGGVTDWYQSTRYRELDHFGDDELPRPPGLQRIAKSQRSGSNSTASSGSNPVAYQEFMAEQYDLDRKVKMQVLSQESEDRRRLIQAQKIAEDMKVLQIDTSGMDPTYAAIINAQKERIRAEYLPPN
ncbi:hypothetical protein Tco_0995704 [Tanacetum coccineum]